MKNATLTAALLALALLIIAGCSATSEYYTMEGKEFTDVDYGYPVEYVQVRNVRIGYIDEGEGDRVLLMIHGLGSNAAAWKRNIEDLKSDYRCIAVDLPGYGYSQKEFYPYGMKFYAQVLTEMLDNLGIDKAVWIGHSMGGQIAITAELEYPDYVESLVLVSPAGIERFTEGEKDWFRKVAVPELTLDASVRQIDINLRSNFHETPEEAEFMIKDRIQVRGASDFEDYAYAVAQNIKAMVNEPVVDRLGEIDAQTLVLFGEYDQLIPNRFLHGGPTADVAAKAAELIPNADVILLDDTGHFVQFESPDMTNRAIRDFLQ